MISDIKLWQTWVQRGIPTNYKGYEVMRSMWTLSPVQLPDVVAIKMPPKTIRSYQRPSIMTWISICSRWDDPPKKKHVIFRAFFVHIKRGWGGWLRTSSNGWLKQIGFFAQSVTIPGDTSCVFSLSLLFVVFFCSDRMSSVPFFGYSLGTATMGRVSPASVRRRSPDSRSSARLFRLRRREAKRRVGCPRIFPIEPLFFLRTSDC